MTLLDSFMLIENVKNRTIFGGIGVYTKLKYSQLSDLRLKLIKQHPRLRQKVVSLFGAYYFKDISIEEALKGVEKLEGYHTKEELELFCEKICQEPLPKDGPLWKV